MQKVDKRPFQLAKIAVVSRHVIGFDIGDNGHHRLQMQK